VAQPYRTPGLQYNERTYLAFGQHHLSRSIIKADLPTEEALVEAHSRLAALESALRSKEEEYAAIRADLHEFQMDYLRTVGPLHAELEELQTEYRKLWGGQGEGGCHRGTDGDDTAAGAGCGIATHARAAASDCHDLRSLYLEAVRRMHPDLGDTDGDRERRHHLMIEANVCYERGDGVGLQSLLEEWDAVTADAAASDRRAQLIRAQRKIAYLEARLRQMERELEQTRRSDLARLHKRAVLAERFRRDIIGDIARELEEQIAELRGRLQARRAAGSV
jgi:hypothetical protein